MTKQEALIAMKTHRVRHRYFGEGEWIIMLSTGEYYLEDGVICSPNEFWAYRTVPEWDTDWEIIPNNERSIG